MVFWKQIEYESYNKTIKIKPTNFVVVNLCEENLKNKNQFLITIMIIFLIINNELRLNKRI